MNCSTIGQYIKNVALALPYNILRALDCFGNALAGGDYRETISSRLGKDQETDPLARFWARIVDTIMFWEKDHCNKSEDPRVGDEEVF